MVFTFLASNELVFINFYADWCRFSNILQPIFDEAADMVISYAISIKITYVYKINNRIHIKTIVICFSY